MKVLLTGATGVTGRVLLKSFKIKDFNIVTFSRNHVEKGFNSHHRVGDLYSIESLESIVKDIDVIYHIPPNMHKDEILLSSNLINCLKKYNIKHFIYHSVLHPNIQKLSHHWNKMKVEELIINSGINYTILQPSSYMQNIFNDINNINISDTHYVPFSIHSRLSLVDLDDVGEVAALIVGNNKHFFSKYELSGPQMLSAIDKAKILTEVLKKNITAKEQSIQNLEKILKDMGLDRRIINLRIDMFKHYNNSGLPGNSTILEMLLGKKPSSFKNFINKNIHKFK